MSDEFRIDPSSVRKRLEVALRDEESEVDLESLIDEEKDVLEELIESDEEENKGEIVIDLEEEEEEGDEVEREEEKEEVKESEEFEKSEDLEGKSEEELDEDDVDYSFEGYAEIDDPLAEIEFEASCEEKRFEELLRSLEQSDVAVEIAEGIYLAHPNHILSIHDEDILPETLSIYEVRGVRGFWQHTGIVVPDVDTAVVLADMLRKVPNTNTKIMPNSFKELVLLVKDTGIYVLSRLRSNPFVYLMDRRVRI